MLSMRARVARGMTRARACRSMPSSRSALRVEARYPVPQTMAPAMGVDFVGAELTTHLRHLQT